jgi:NAD-dependent protein deacetylase/lipoamidase
MQGTGPDGGGAGDLVSSHLPARIAAACYKESTMTQPDGLLQELAARIRTAHRVTVLTGAGISAASGVPTFRGAGGLWRTFRAEDLATPDAFRRDPRLVWEWYDWRRSVIAQCRPNPAHDVLARWSHREGFALITQNVDGLHEQAGARGVIRLHGSIWHLRCVTACHSASDFWEDRSTPLEELPPRCPGCGAHARPDVVWFGEPLDPGILQRCLAATGCDVFLSIGTSSVVYPAAGFASRAKTQGAYTVEINPEPTGGAPYLDLAIAMPAEQALPALDQC